MKMLSYTNSAFWAGLTYFSAICSMLVRNVIFARLLHPDDFSIALTFGVVLSFFEYLSGFGHELLMQRSKDGNTPRFQATMHTVMVLRGVLIALFVVLIAPVIPVLLNLPEDAFNYALLAIVPLINAFAHLDPQRAHRHNDFKLTAKIGIIGDSTSIVIALICIAIWKDYWAFYISFVFRHSICTLLSHWLATRPYRLGLEKNHLLALWNFGLPLILIGTLKYFGTELDKALIARYAGLAEFTLYFLTIMVTANAANIVSIGLSKIFIRRISTSTMARLNRTAFENGIISLYLVLPILFTITIFGEQTVTIIFGQQYSPVPYLFPAVVILVAFRQLSNWLSQIVVGCADTKLMLKADIVKIFGLAALLPIAIYGDDVRFFALAFAISEIIYILFLSRLVSNVIQHFTATSLVLIGITSVSVTGFILVYWITHNSEPLTTVSIFSISLLSLIGTLYFFSQTCRNETRKLTKVVRNRLV